MPTGIGTALIASAVISGAGSAIAANQVKKANDGARGIAERLTYQPVDIEKIKKDAADQAVSNATASLDLERRLQPDVAAARAGLSKSVNDQLALGGRLPADIANKVAQTARVAGGVSGGFGGTPGVTAATIGTTALDLLQRRQGNAAGLLSANPLPVAGLDPGSLASLEVQENAANNQFNASKAGVQTNLLNSNAAGNAAAIGSGANTLASLVGLYGALSGGGGVKSQVIPGVDAIAGSVPNMTPYNVSASRIPGWS